MMKKETTSNLNDFPLRHILKPTKGHILFVFLFSLFKPDSDLLMILILFECDLCYLLWFFWKEIRYLLFMKIKQKVDTLRTKKEWPKVTVMSILVFAECFLLQGVGVRVVWGRWEEPSVFSERRRGSFIACQCYPGAKEGTCFASSSG